jgi:hypothetical protein
MLVSLVAHVILFEFVLGWHSHVFSHRLPPSATVILILRDKIQPLDGGRLFAFPLPSEDREFGEEIL